MVKYIVMHEVSENHIKFVKSFVSKRQANELARNNAGYTVDKIKF